MYLESQWVKGYCRVQCQLPGVEMTEVKAHMATYSLFAADYWRQVAHRQYKFQSRPTVVEVTLGKGHA